MFENVLLPKKPFSAALSQTPCGAGAAGHQCMDVTEPAADRVHRPVEAVDGARGRQPRGLTEFSRPVDRVGPRPAVDGPADARSLIVEPEEVFAAAAEEADIVGAADV